MKKVKKLLPILFGGGLATYGIWFVYQEFSSSWWQILLSIIAILCNAAILIKFMTVTIRFKLFVIANVLIWSFMFIVLLLEFNVVMIENFHKQMSNPLLLNSIILVFMGLEILGIWITTPKISYFPINEKKPETRRREYIVLGINIIVILCSFWYAVCFLVYQEMLYLILSGITFSIAMIIVFLGKNIKNNVLYSRL